jgi:hypothetical protein
MKEVWKTCIDDNKRHKCGGGDHHFSKHMNNIARFNTIVNIFINMCLRLDLYTNTCT